MVSHSVSCFPSKPTGRNCSETARARQGEQRVGTFSVPTRCPAPSGRAFHSSRTPVGGGAEIPRSVPDRLRKQIQFSLKTESSLTCLAQRFAPGSLIVYQLRTLTSRWTTWLTSKVIEQDSDITNKSSTLHS